VTGPRFNNAHIAWAKYKYFSSKRHQKMNTLTAGKELGVSKTTISRWRAEAGIPPPARAINEARAAKVKILVKTKEFGFETKQSLLSIPDLCKLVDLPYHTVFRLQKNLGVHPMGDKYRRNSGRLPLTKDPADLELVKLASEWHLPPGMVKDLESLRVQS